jgi:mannitol 2-dehydrogenase
MPPEGAVIRLTDAALSSLPPSVAGPGYDRGKVRVGIVHVGVGGFHRSHEAMYIDRLLNEGDGDQWGICGVGLLPGDRAMQQVLRAQDNLYCLVLKHPGGDLESRVIGSLVEYLFAPDDAEAVIERMASPDTRIVSLTLTEGGYNLHPVTGEFDPQNPQVVHDLQPGATPATAFGLVTEALVRRRARGLPPVTVLSCDNLEGNGDVARTVFSAYGQLRDPELGEWMRREVHFPNSMVDRITPRTTDADRELVAERLGIQDGWPVVCEPFTQWVLEDHFGAGRPALERVGVQFVEDVRPYELMKLRLLNAGHQALCYLGYLSGYRYLHEVCQDPLFEQFVVGYMEREATPTLPPVPGIDLAEYRHSLIERFANAEIRDSLARLGTDSSERIPKFLLPVVREQLARGGELDRAALVVAAWARYAEGTDEQGGPIEVVDPRRDQLMAAARRQRQDPTAFIADRDLFDDLIDQPRFVEAYLSALRSLHTRGARAAVAGLGTDDGTTRS